MYRLRKLTRDATLIATSICAFLILFALQALLSDTITGGTIQVGRPDDTIVVGDDQPKQQQPPPVELDPNVQCWLNRGLRMDDLALVGPLLQHTACTPSLAQQPITATFSNRCLLVHTGTDSSTQLCLEEEAPAFSVLLPTPMTAPITLPPMKPNYWLAMLLFFLGIGILLLWGRLDLQHAYYRRRTTTAYSRLLPGRHEVEIRYIKPPPTYLKKISPSASKIPAHAPALPHAHLKKIPESSALASPPGQQPAPALAEQPLFISPLNKPLIAFNTLSQELCDLIAEKQFTQAEQRYPKLYRLALDLYPQVQAENKKRLMHVVSTLHGQLKDLRKAYSVAQDVRRTYQVEQQQRPEPVYQPKVWEPAKATMKKEQLRHLDEELTKLRHLLEQEEHPTLVQQFKKRLWH